MARAQQSSLRLRSKTRKQTTNRSSAKFGRNELDALKSDRRASKRSEYRDRMLASESGEERSSSARTRGASSSGSSTGRRSSSSSASSEQRSGRRSDGNSAGRKSSQSGRGADTSTRSTKRGASSRADSVERHSGMNATERHRAQRQAYEHIDESPRERKSPSRTMPIPGKEVKQQGALRLNKFLADAGIASRRGADELIEAGVVKVNGKIVTEQGTRVHPADLVTVKGEPVSYLKHLSYLVLNKPKDFITTTNDEKGRKTVMDLIPIKQRLYPVGRLDRNTTGTLIITNDGELATRLMHPSHEIEREYVVGLDKRLMPEHAKAIAGGVDLEDGMTGPAELFINPDDRSEIRIILREGRNREVRRIFEHFGYEVKRLHRARYANISVVGLARAEYRHLSRDEVRQLRKMVGLDH